MTPIAAPAPTPSSLLTRVAVGVSIAVHIVAVLLSLGYAGAGLFASDEAEPIAVSLVTPDEIPEPPALPTAEAERNELDLRPSQTEPLQKPPSPPDRQTAATPSQPMPQPPQAAPLLPQQQPAQAAYAQPQPDISMKYQVDLGLKMMAAAPTPATSAQDGTSDFDAPAMNKANIAGTSVAAFRAKLKQCATLPTQISPDDKVVIVLRAMFTPDAKLATTPVLIEASASAKGPALMQAAISALQICQPHSALPAESYAEWRVLDLRFTPQDFKRG